MRTAVLLLFALAVAAAQRLEIPIDIEIHKESGWKLDGNFSILVTGTYLNAHLDWSLLINNKTNMYFRTIEFCVMLIGVDMEPIANERGHICLIRVPRAAWGSNEIVSARGKQKKFIQPLAIPIKIVGARVIILDFRPNSEEARLGKELPPDNRDWAEKVRSVKVPATPDVLIMIDASEMDSEIEIDRKFVGSTPTNVKVAPGSHEIVIRKAGFREWRRTIAIESGEFRRVTASMEKQ